MIRKILHQNNQQLIEEIKFHNKYHGMILLPRKEGQSDRDYFHMCWEHHYNTKIKENERLL